MSDKAKMKIGIYWAASCGGCDVVTTHINEKILDLIEVADIVFWPCAMDFKYDDLRQMADGEMDVCLFNGAIRNSDHEELAELIRKKSKVLIAFGSCACFGGIPGLSNVTTAEESIRRAYLEEPTTLNPEKVLPRLEVRAPEGDLTLPRIWDTVHTLKQVVDVDYFVPGCPPTAELTGSAVDAIISGKLPPAGSVIAGNKALCDECDKVKKNEMRMIEFKAPWETEIDPEQCLMEQGIVCSGPATRSGCGAQCTKVNMPCRGCFGPPDGVEDQGAALLGAIASVVSPPAGKSIDDVFSGLRDPLGLFYRFSLADSMLRRTKISK